MARWSAALVQRAEATFNELSRRADMGDAMRALIDRLAGPVERLLTELRTPPSPPAISKIRHHGDLHLGQVLLAKDDVYILDFEGEPQRSLEERRRKAPAARDVAGLVRSIDYAATAALERALETWTDEHDRLFNALEDWSRQSVATFMAAYREGLANPLLWPGDGADADRLLDFFLLEKVFYEINYELANRPNWLRVPLTGLQRILSQRS
jgi:maltose alpha-D-glucosyltransferase/alpha-amylase